MTKKIKIKNGKNEEKIEKVTEKNENKNEKAKTWKNKIQNEKSIK